MTDARPTPILARITPPPARRWFAVLCVAALGGVTLWIAFATPPGDLWALVFLLGFGGLCLYMADRLRRATEGALVLTPAGLTDQDGVLIVPLTDIRAVSRGVFAFKPSNGFVLRLAAPAPVAWVPGLWWRVGRRLGVGGVISGSEGRFMAERIEMLLTETRGRNG